MNKNDVVTLKIEDMSLEGAGIGHTDGVTVFVKDAVVGDVVAAVITKVKKTFCFAAVKEIIEASPFRVTPPCPNARICGGCQIMQVSYDKQLEIKDNVVKSNLVKIGGFDRAFVEKIMEPIIGMTDPFRYRNKAQVPVGVDKNGQLIAGFYGARSHRIVPSEDCKICSEMSMKIVAAVLAFMRENAIKAYDESTGKGLIRHVLIREGKASGQTMVCIVACGKKLPKADLLIEKLLTVCSQITSIVLNINTRRDNVIMGFETITLWGKDSIEDSITLSSGDTISFDISANSFYQVNHDKMERLYSKALEYANLTGKENVWDLYCGIGTISLSLAAHAKNVYGVEVVPQAIINAKSNANKNGYNNAKFFCGEAEIVLPEFYAGGAKALLEKEGYLVAADENMTSPDVIVVDPPRKGCDEKCLETMIKMQPERIVYVSCDSATLARDLKYLCENGYELIKGVAVDQFGHTMHVETVCLLSKLHEAKHHVRVKLDMDEMSGEQGYI